MGHPSNAKVDCVVHDNWSSPENKSRAARKELAKYGDDSAEDKIVADLINDWFDQKEKSGNVQRDGGIYLSALVARSLATRCTKVSIAEAA